MVPGILQGLAEEKIVLVKPHKDAAITFPVKGIIRLVDGKGQTLGLVLDKQVLDELGDDAMAQNPAFIASLNKSRKSGRISGLKVKKKARLK